MLFQVIDSLSQEPWEWGAMDCCQFARRVLIETKGIDVAKDQPTYSTPYGAAKILANAGGMEAFLSSMLGEPVQRNLIRRGDVCLHKFPHGFAAGISVGQAAAFASENGVVYIPMKSITKGWNV